MADNEETIQTDVDNLLKLVKEKKEISFENAASELGVPIDTIEAWSTFMEEENLVSIIYKFTTPYLTYESAKDALHSDNMKLVSSKSVEISEMFTLLDDLVEKGDYQKAHKHSIQIHKKIKDFLSTAKNDKEIIKHFDEGVLNQRLEHFQNFLSHAKSLISKKDVERLKSAFKRIKTDFLDVYVDLNNAFMKVKKLREENALKEAIEKGEDPHDDIIKDDSFNKNNLKDDSFKDKSEENIVKENNEGFKEKLNESENKKEEIQYLDHMDLIKKANDELKKGNLDTAKKYYNLLEKAFHSLPNKYEENRNNLKKALINLNDELSSKLNDYSVSQMKSLSNEIDKKIEESKILISNKNLDKAENLYKEIESIFHSLPTGFIEKKIEIENKIIDLHSKLINVEKEQYSFDLHEGEKKIYEALDKILELINKKRIAEAQLIYKDVKEVFSSLPSGFLSDKIEVQSRIFEAYQKLMLAKKAQIEKDFNKKAIEIKKCSQEVEKNIEEDKFEMALQNLDKANSLFDTLPKGFFDLKSNIETDLLTLSKKVSIIEKEHSTNKFNIIKNKIDKSISIFENYLQKKQYDLAHEMYKEAMILYNNLPKGFLTQKTEIRKNLLEIYKRVMLYSDSHFINSSDVQTKNKYDSLLKLIISIHDHIEKREFEIIEQKYNHVVSLYNELPIGFIQNRINIRHELLKLYDVIQLYKKTKQLDFVSDDVEKISELIGIIHALYDELCEDCLEDSELFEYVKERYDYYSSILKREGLDGIKRIRESDKLNFNQLKKERRDKKNLNDINKDIELKKDIEIKKENRMFVKERDKTKISTSLFEKSISLIVSGNFDDAYSNLKMILSFDSLNINAQNLIGIIPKIKSRSYWEEHRDEIESFIRLLGNINKDVIDSIDAKLVRIKLIRSFNEYLNYNYSAAIIDMKRIVEIYPYEEDAKLLLRYMENHFINSHKDFNTNADSN